MSPERDLPIRQSAVGTTQSPPVREEAVKERIRAIHEALTRGPQRAEKNRSLMLRDDVNYLLGSIIRSADLGSDYDEDNDAEAIDRFIRTDIPVLVNDVFAARSGGVEAMFNMLDEGLGTLLDFDLSDWLSGEATYDASDDENLLEGESQDTRSLQDRFYDLLNKLANFRTFEPDTVMPNHQDAHYLITRAVDREKMEASRADKKLTDFATIAARLIRKSTVSEAKYRRKDVKAFLQQYLIDNKDKLRDTDMGSTQQRSDFLDVLCEYANIDRRRQEYRDVSEEVAAFVVSFIKEYASKDKHKRYTELFDEYSATVANVDLETIFGMDIYGEARALGNGLAMDLQMLRTGTPESAKDSPATAFYASYTPRDLDELHNATVNTLTTIADQIKEEVLPRELHTLAYGAEDSGSTKRYREILNIDDLDELKALIVETRVIDEESFLIRRFAIARLTLIHTALLILIEYNERLSVDATSAFIRRVNASSFFEQVESPLLKLVEESGDEEQIEEAKKKYGRYAFKIKGVPGAILHIADPKLIPSVGRKVLVKEDIIELLAVVKDGVRFVILHEDETFKDEETAWAGIQQAMSRVMPVTGTDYYYERSRVALKEGARTNDNSTSDRKSVQFTFRLKFPRYWKAKRKKQERNIHGHISSVSAEIHHEPISQFMQQSDRAQYEAKLREQAANKLGINTEFADFFSALAAMAVDFDEYNESVDLEVSQSMNNIRARVASQYGEYINDPLVSIYKYLVDLLSGPDRDKIKNFIRQVVRKKAYAKKTYVTLANVFSVFADRSPNNTSFVTAANVLHEAISMA